MLVAERQVMNISPEPLSYSIFASSEGAFEPASGPQDDLSYDIPCSCETDILQVTSQDTLGQAETHTDMIALSAKMIDTNSASVKAGLIDQAKIRTQVKRAKRSKSDSGMPIAPDVKLWDEQFDELTSTDLFDVTIGYWRVSSTHQTEGYGTDVQRKHVIAWTAAKQMNGDVSERGVDMWVWDVDSGREESRQGFEFVRRAVATGRVKWVVAYRYDRFARNQFYSELIHREFRPKRTALVSATEDLPKGPLGELMRQIIQAISQYESSLIAERLSRGKKEAVRQHGSYYGGTAPFGYLAQLVADNGKGLLRICEPEAEIVRLIFYLYGRGYSPYAIADYLADRGIPRRNLRQTWSQSNVNRILHREAQYRGEALFGTLKTDGSPAQEPILPHRANLEERTYIWGQVKALRGARVPDDIEAEPLKPRPRKNSVDNMTPVQARVLQTLFAFLDEGDTYLLASQKLNELGYTTLKGATWSEHIVNRYVGLRSAYEVAIRTFLDPELGELNVDSNAHRRAVDMERAAMRRIRELKKKGMGLRAITAKVNEEGFTTLSGNQWYPSTVERVVKGLGKASDRYVDRGAGQDG